ncbi:MAG: AbrB/MazE/SpoVT family DNA-binding domain-containing protein [Proteobacteria bacterium]|nr:AbrB/MazE/SpoVT family DNA-binding domain-containing protein [Pseudomonadota bacterium]
MEVKLFKNGQSMAIRLPAQWLRDGNFSDSVDLEKKNDGSIVIKPLKENTRKNWAEAAAKLSESEPIDEEWIETGIDDGLKGAEW